MDKIVKMYNTKRGQRVDISAISVCTMHLLYCTEYLIGESATFHLSNEFIYFITMRLYTDFLSPQKLYRVCGET